MQLGGVHKLSLIDFPGRPSCVVFVTGCNFHCPYCHNPELARGRLPTAGSLQADDLLAFLSRRRGLLEGVVISGGEPTLMPDLPWLLRAVRRMGFRIKLDTNGSRPDMLQRLIAAGAVDYIAMDVKTAPERYVPLLCDEADVAAAIRASVALLRQAAIDHEFRTTCLLPLLDAAALDAIGELINGAPRYVLQRCRPQRVLSPAFFTTPGHTPVDDATLIKMRAHLRPFAKQCLIR
jgi:pyruvate formate lyase activating enzyme